MQLQFQSIGTTSEGMERCYNENDPHAHPQSRNPAGLHDMLPERHSSPTMNGICGKYENMVPQSFSLHGGIFTAQMLHMFMHESEKQRMPMACYFEPRIQQRRHAGASGSYQAGNRSGLCAAQRAGGKLCTVDGVEDF